MVYRLVEEGIVARQDGPVGKEADEAAKPEPADRHGEHEVEPVPLLDMHRRCGLPVGVDESHHEDEDCDPGQPSAVRFEVGAEQQREGHEEVQDDDQVGEDPPHPRGARHVPGHFLRKVSRPGNDQLRHREIGPQHGEGKHLLAPVMEVSGTEHFVHRFEVVFNVGEENRQFQRTVKRRASGPGNQLEVLKYAPRLGLDAAFLNLLGTRI